MFRFTELTLQNWDYFQNVRVPLDGDVVLVTGPNGSGKTTFIDAIRQLVGARRLSSRRHTEHYVRDPARFPLIRAIVSNTAQNGSARPFLHERITSDEVTLAFAVVTNRSGDLERRYAIRAGRASVAELQGILLESRDFYPPERYQRALQNAGLSRSMLHVIALEQGKTNALFEVGPRDLFERVIDIRGDREILERYREARRRYEDTEKELNQQIDALRRNRFELDGVRREVERLDKWVSARDMVAHLGTVLPAARLQEKLRRKRELGSRIKALHAKELATENEISALSVRLEELRAAESGAKRALDSAAEREKQSQAARDAAIDARARTGAEVIQLEKKQAELDALGSSEGELEDLEVAAGEADRAKFRAEEKREQSATRLKQAEQRVARLRAGLPDYPETVVKTLDALHEKNIPAKLVAQTVEIADIQLAEAAESALGMARYGIVLAEEHAPVAIRIATDLRFPGPVYSGNLTDEKTVAGPIVLERGAPTWLRSWPRTVELATNGNWSNDKGIWVTPVEDRVLGESARKAGLKRAERELTEARATLSVTETGLAAAVTSQEAARAVLKREARRRQLGEELAGLPQARSAAAAAVTSADDGEQQLSQARARFEAARAAHDSCSSQLANSELRHSNAAGMLASTRADLQAVRAEASELDGVIAELDHAVGGELRARAERGELGAPETVEHDLADAKVKFEALGDPPAESVRDEERVLRANVEESERHVEQREREAAAARSELEQCRTRYLEVVNQTLVDLQAPGHRYRRDRRRRLGDRDPETGERRSAARRSENRGTLRIRRQGSAAAWRPLLQRRSASNSRAHSPDGDG